MIFSRKTILFAAIALTLQGCGASGQKSENPWEGGPQPEKAAESPSAGLPLTQTSTGNEEKDSQDKGAGHPAAEPPMPQAKFGECTHMHPGGKPPEIVRPAYREAIADSFRTLCYRSFHLGHSGRTRTALWSAEVLDRAKVERASTIERESEFKADERLPESERSELEDYRRSGFDRGHLAPSADMPSIDAQRESFFLSNIVPQDGSMNGGVWRELEINVRQKAKKTRVYVVTGPIFDNSTRALKRRVLVPTALYKAIYEVNKGAYVTVISNDQRAQRQDLTVEQFTRIYGIDPFPALSKTVKQHNLSYGPMPEPKAEESEGAKKPEGNPGLQPFDPKCIEYKTQGGKWIPKEEYERLYPNTKEVDFRYCGSAKE